MSIAQFQQELSKGLPSPVYLLYSPDDFLLYRTLVMIRETEYGENTFNFDVFDAESPDHTLRAEQVVDVLNTLPFMTPRRVVVLRNVQKLPKKELSRLKDYLESPSPSSLLVMLHLGTAQKAAELTGMKTIRAISLKVEEREIPAWVMAEGKRKGVEFTDGAVEHLISSVGTDLGMLSAEIEKCTLAGVKSIDVETLKGVLYTGIDYSAFDLVEALNKGHAKEVFHVFQHLEKAAEPQMLLGALNWHFTRLESRLTREGRGVYDEVFRVLHEADVAVKTSRPYALETLLIRLLRIMQREEPPGRRSALR